MEKITPVRKPHTSTADLLTWLEYSPTPEYSSARSRQPSDGIGKVVFGGQVTDEEVESLNKSGIFKPKAENGLPETTEDADPSSLNRTGLRMYQQTVAGVSHISFGEEEEKDSPKKPASLPEAAKQRELTGNMESESEAKLRKQISDAKNKELSGNGIFAPPPEIKPRPLSARALGLRESITIGEHISHNVGGGNGTGAWSDESMIKTAKKIPNQKFTELSGNGIFKGDTPPPSSEQALSSAKLREMSGSNIFGDVKVEPRDYLGGVRKPPGGESSIALV